MATVAPKSRQDPPQEAGCQSQRIRPLASRWQLPRWMSSSPSTFVISISAATLFVYFSRQRIWHTDVWGHLSYARLIWETGQIPLAEPFMPLSAGMTYVDTAWLGQLIGLAAHALWGVAGLQFLYATCITLTTVLLLWQCYHRTGELLISLSAAGLFLWVEWQQLMIIRPQLGRSALLCRAARVSKSTHALTDWPVVCAAVVPRLGQPPRVISRGSGGIGSLLGRTRLRRDPPHRKCGSIAAGPTGTPMPAIE